MVRVPLKPKEVLYMPGQPLEAVHFIESGIVSILTVLKNGDCAEVGVVGREGMVGIPLVIGTGQSINEAMVLVGGHALRLGRADLRTELQRSPAFAKLMMQYLQAAYAQVSQTAACNAHHTLDERLARWLLLAHDRGNSDEIELTHEFLSMMLGVHRPAVSIAAGNLQKLGILGYARGHIHILDRAALEAAACECYQAVQHHTLNIFNS
jgi:CRP-like cAMP-binding protein